MEWPFLIWLAVLATFWRNEFGADMMDRGMLRERRYCFLNSGAMYLARKLVRRVPRSLFQDLRHFMKISFPFEMSSSNMPWPR